MFSLLISQRLLYKNKLIHTSIYALFVTNYNISGRIVKVNYNLVADHFRILFPSLVTF